MARLKADGTIDRRSFGNNPHGRGGKAKAKAPASSSEAEEESDSEDSSAGWKRQRKQQGTPSNPVGSGSSSKPSRTPSNLVGPGGSFKNSGTANLVGKVTPNASGLASAASNAKNAGLGRPGKNDGITLPTSLKLSCGCTLSNRNALRVFECKGCDLNPHARKTFCEECVDSESNDYSPKFLCTACVTANEEYSEEHGDTETLGLTIEAERLVNDDLEQIEYKVFDPRTKPPTHNWLPAADVDEVVQNAWRQLCARSNSDDAFSSVQNLPMDRDKDEGIWRQSKNRLFEPCERGYWAIAAHIYSHPVQYTILDHDTIEARHPRTWEMQATDMLCHMHHKVIKAICGPGLRFSRLRDPELAEILDNLRDEGSIWPCHYVLELVDINGCGMRVIDMRVLLRVVEHYVDWRNHASLQGRIAEIIEEINSYDANMSGKEAQNMKHCGRRYLTGEGPGEQGVMHRRVTEMIEACRDQIEEYDGEDFVPFHLRDAGYSKNGPVRIDGQQKKRLGSNRIMTLFEVAAIVLSKGEHIQGDFRIQGDVVMVCAQPFHISAGEVLISLMADTYVFGGRGFNGEPAGKHVNSKRDFSSYEVWNTKLADAVNDGPYQDNIRAEAERRKTYTAEMLRNAEEVNRLEKILLERETTALEERMKVQATIRSELDKLESGSSTRGSSS